MFGSHAPDSVGGKRYYVSLIDDYSKFTWIYLLKFKSDVFEKFHEFQTLVERLFDQKIITMQTDWVESIKNSILSLKKLALPIMFLVLMHTTKMALLNASIVTSLKSG
jgi:hypothetical protein